MKYAIINDGVVANVIEWDGKSAWTSPDGTTLAPLGESPAGPGWTYDGNDFSAPVPVVVVPRVYEPREFANKFFTQEQQIELFSSTHPYVVYARGQLTLAKYVDLDAEEFVKLLGSLVVAGMLTPERVQQILNNEGVAS